MTDYIQQFFERVGTGEIEIYNEFSLQHELGIFLRSRIADAKIRFERHVTSFSFVRSQFVKAEIDISVISSAGRPRAAIELKFPRAGQFPEQMFKACQDIVFLEQLVLAGFERGYFIMAADDHLFHRGSRLDGIYRFFRGETPISGQIFGPTGDTTREITMRGHYHVQWRDAARSLRYFVISVDTQTMPKGAFDFYTVPQKMVDASRLCRFHHVL
ncbi:MAG: hypothetical protein ABSG87_08405 [Verrucomicrobiota bacterium]|jgi:hypothetical protein